MTVHNYIIVRLRSAMEYEDLRQMGLRPTESIDVTRKYTRGDGQEGLETKTLYFVGLISVSDTAPNGKLEFCSGYHSGPVNGDNPHKMERKAIPILPKSVDIGDLVLIERPNSFF